MRIMLINFKKIFDSLQSNPRNILFTEEKINDKLFKKLNRLTYEKDKKFVNFFNKNTVGFEEKKLLQ